VAGEPPLSGESVLLRWIGLELGRMNSGIVSGRKTLAVLASEESPSAVTRSGGTYHFDPGTIRILAASLPEEIRRQLRLPIVFFFDSRVPDSCYLADETALAAFLSLGDLSSLRSFHEGRVWVGRAIVYELVRKYPAAVQVMTG
jgi:uncharacterized protein (UPF0216 family)